MKDETVLFNPANKKFCVLNATAALIWNILEQPRTVHEIVTVVCERFDAVDSSRVEQDVRQALDELRTIECVRNSA